MTSCVLKYLVKGVQTDRERKSALIRELSDVLPHAQSIVVLPVVDGFSVEVEMASMTPFNQDSFEPYFAEHILPDAVRIGCREDGEYHLLKARYSG